MADHGRDSDDDDWEEASDIFVVRFEASVSEIERSEEQDTDEESGTLRETVPPVAPRQERLEGRARNLVDAEERGRSQETDRVNRPRTSAPVTPQSDYRSAPLPFLPGLEGSGKDVSPGRQTHRHPRKPAKSYDGRPSIKPPRFEGKDSCLESHLSQFEIISKRNHGTSPKRPIS